MCRNIPENREKDVDPEINTAAGDDEDTERWD